MAVVRNRVRWMALAPMLVVSAMRLEAQSPAGHEEPGRKAARPAQISTPAQPAPKDPAQRSWAARHPVILGTLIGAGSVAVAGAAGRGNRSAAITGSWVLAGAGGGALAGSIVSAVQKSKLHYDPPAHQMDILAVKRIVAGLGVGQGVIVSAANAQQTKGRIQSVGQDEFGIVPDRQTAPIQIAYASVRSIRAKPAGMGKKIGIASGIVGGVVLSWLVCYGAGGCGGVS